MTTLDRARNYLANCPGAPDGDRDNTTLATACKLVERFDLSHGELLSLLLEWDQQQNHPPVGERVVAKCLRSAMGRTAYDPQKSKSRDEPRRERRDPPPRTPNPPAAPLPTEDELAEAVRIMIGGSQVAKVARGYLQQCGIDPYAVGWGLSKLTVDECRQLGISASAAGIRYLIPVRNPITGQLEDVRRYAGGPFGENVDGGAKLLPWAKGHGSAKPYRFGDAGGQDVVWAEGEKDCEALRCNGFIAVSNTCGCGAAAGVAEALPERLLPQSVTILFDADEAGSKGASKLAETLSRRGVAVRIATWPDDSPSGYDVSDWFSDGRPVNELRGLLASGVEITAKDPLETSDGLPVVLDAERTILGAVVFGGLDTFAIADETVRAEHFHDDRHRAVWNACAALASAGTPIDAVSVPAMMRQQKAPDVAASIDYLTELVDRASQVGLLGVSEKLAHHAALVRKAGVTRKLVTMSHTMADELLEPGADPEQVLEAFVDKSAKTLETRSTRDHYHRDNFMQKWLDQSVRRDRRISTGMAIVDASLRGGWWSPHIHGLIARPKTGKSAMFAGWISAAFTDVLTYGKGEKIGIMSLEMPFEQEMARIMAIRENIAYNDLELGPNYLLRQGSNDAFRRVTEATALFEKHAVILDVRGITMTQFRANAARMVEYDGCVVIFVENVNHIRAQGEKMVDRLTRAVEETNDIAGQLNVPIVGAMQLNRAGAGDNPSLDDVFGSDALARDCFWAGALIRHKRKYPDEPVTGKLKVVANRGGREPIIDLLGDEVTFGWVEDARQGGEEDDQGMGSRTIIQGPDQPVIDDDPDRPWHADL